MLATSASSGAGSCSSCWIATRTESKQGKEKRKKPISIIRPFSYWALLLSPYGEGLTGHCLCTGLPSFCFEQAHAKVAIVVNVWVIDWCQEANLWTFEWVLYGKVDGQIKHPSNIGCWRRLQKSSKLDWAFYEANVAIASLTPCNLAVHL